MATITFVKTHRRSIATSCYLFAFSLSSSPQLDQNAIHLTPKYIGIGESAQVHFKIRRCANRITVTLMNANANSNSRRIPPHDIGFIPSQPPHRFANVTIYTQNVEDFTSYSIFVGFGSKRSQHFLITLHRGEAG
ncbi:hypothetical protein PoB_002458600 [Plakobranchus ocellatus]|uniref:Uncharacterized protein n=1 Tax=Plakobranchus ocellatus TaxID=259542 RepID=A0AAV3ZU86_9GAST|nr:hypothetical protein PoB_002458600 [Plakobranchus ocellatus]